MGTGTTSGGLEWAVIASVADAKGVDPTALEPPLNSVIDLDALESLFANRPDTTGKVVFEYDRFELSVSSDGKVDIEEMKRH